MTGRHAGKAGRLPPSFRWVAALLGIPGIVLAVLGILALLGWGIYLIAEYHPPVYLILWVITTIIWAGKFVQEWRETRRFPWFTAGIVAFTVLAALSTAAPSWPWLRPVGYVLAGLFAAYLIKLYSRRRRIHGPFA